MLKYLPTGLTLQILIIILESLVIPAAKRLAAKTDNKVDDDVVDTISKILAKLKDA